MCNPALNDIKVGLKKAPGGVFLYAEHSLLTYQSFFSATSWRASAVREGARDYGPLHWCVQEWVRLYSSKLSAAGIVRVGISSASGDSYFHKVKSFR